MQRTQLRDLLSSALSFGGSGSAGQWERHLVDGFDAFLGGFDVFGTTDNRGEAHTLVTIVERGSVRFYVYGGGVFMPDLVGIEKIRYAITGRGLMVRYLTGEHAVVREEIESGYRTALELFGTEGFADMCDKSIPHTAAQDPTLIDVERGVAECITLTPGEIRNPLKIEVPRTKRLQAGSYHDLRAYGSYEDLFNGVYGAWISLVSSRETDWTRFVEVTQSIFITMKQ